MLILCDILKILMDTQNKPYQETQLKKKKTFLHFDALKI